ncbi:MAG: hypothetical protein J3Q66DRAFT_435059 [Benniella sp.]|nr:MAG: hypothetical protein J3Q66DRAFT_435059 [Benniella sp.]
MKKLDWELEKGMRAEKDLAVSGALRMAQEEDGTHRKVLFAYGDGRFDNRMNLKTLHQAIKVHLLVKATAAGHVVASSDEYFSSTMSPGCVVRGCASRVFKEKPVSGLHRIWMPKMAR